MKLKVLSPAVGCAASHYGPGCMKTCMCGLRPCDPATGECLCPSGTHGPSCLQGESDSSCASLSIGVNNYCQPLFTFMNMCVLFPAVCAPGRWGESCLQECQCQNGASCDRVSGKCHCLPGYVVSTLLVFYFMFGCIFQCLFIPC